VQMAGSLACFKLNTHNAIIFADNKGHHK